MRAAALMRVQMAAAPSPYGIDNVVYGSAPAAYGAVAASPYQTMAAPAYAARRAGLCNGSCAVLRSAATPRYAATLRLTGRSPASPSAASRRPDRIAMAGGYPGMVAASPAAYSPPAQQFPYTLDSGDRLRVVVFGQDGLTNSYVVDASGDIAMPLIGSVAARGLTTDQLSARIADLLRQGYVRDPHVAVEIEAYRPFFILGEVTQPGQYPYVANMTVETAVAIAGGFTAARLQGLRRHQPQLRRRSLSLQDADHRSSTAGRHHSGAGAVVLIRDQGSGIRSKIRLLIPDY